MVRKRGWGKVSLLECSGWDRLGGVLRDFWAKAESCGVALKEGVKCHHINDAKFKIAEVIHIQCPLQLTPGYGGL